MQALCTKSRKKGSRKLTCPKVDMPKWRHVLCALSTRTSIGATHARASSVHDPHGHRIAPFVWWPSPIARRQSTHGTG